MATSKIKKIRRKQRRQRKVRFLRDRLSVTTSASDRRRLIEKIVRISPRAPVPEKIKSV